MNACDRGWVAMPRDITISPSQMDTLACRLNWHWGYRQGYKSREGNINLLFGDAIHQALEDHYMGKADLVESFLTNWDNILRGQEESGNREYLVKLREHRSLGEVMLTGYRDAYGGPEAEPFEVIQTEQTIRQALPIPGVGESSPYLLVSRLDGLVRMRDTGELFSLEHKTYSRLDGEHIKRDHQFSSQVWLGRMYATYIMDPPQKFAGVLYNGLRKARPSARAAAPLFHREKVYRNERQLEVFLHRAYNMAHEANTPGFSVYPNPNPIRCGYCDFKKACDAYSRGEDYHAILDKDFYKRGGR